VSGGNISDPYSVASGIGEMIANMGTRKRSAVVAVSNLAMVTRVVNIPRVAAKEIRPAVLNQIEDLIPFPLEDVAYDFTPLDSPSRKSTADDGQRMDVLIAAARRDAIWSLVTALREANIRSVAVETKPIAALRPMIKRLVELGRNEGTASIFIDIGAESSTLVLLKGQRFLASRNLGMSGRDFSKAVAESFGLDEEAAQQAKERYAMARLPEGRGSGWDLDTEWQEFDPRRMYEAIRPVLLQLVGDIRRSLEFFEDQYGQLNINYGFISGGGSRLAGLGALIGDELGIQVELVNPFESLQIDQNIFDRNELKKIGPAFAVSVGLAIRGANFRA
jgi:type IV pilus assembly protein PilM